MRHAGGEHHAVEELMSMPRLCTISRLVAAGADHHAQPRAREDEGTCQRQRQAHAADEEAIDRIGHHVARAAIEPASRAGATPCNVVADQQAAQFLEHQDQP